MNACNPHQFQYPFQDLDGDGRSFIAIHAGLDGDKRPCGTGQILKLMGITSVFYSLIKSGIFLWVTETFRKTDCGRLVCVENQAKNRLVSDGLKFFMFARFRNSI